MPFRSSVSAPLLVCRLAMLGAAALLIGGLAHAQTAPAAATPPAAAPGAQYGAPGQAPNGQGAGGQPRRRREPPPGVPAIRQDIAALKPISTEYPVEGSPDWGVITPEATWISSARANHVVQLLNKEGKPGLVVDVNRPCAGLTELDGSIWTPSCGDKKLERIDPKTGKITASLDADPENSEGGITAGAGSVWMVIKPATLVRIDPKTNTIVAQLPIPGAADTPAGQGAANPAFGGGYVWVSTFSGNSVVKVDPKTDKIVATIPVGSKPRFITYGADSAWVLNQGDGDVTRIDAKTNKTTTIHCGLTGSGGDLSFGDGYLWAALFDFPLTQIDPKTNEPVRQWAGPGGDGMRAGGGNVWLSNLRQQTVWKIPVAQIK